MENRFMRTRHTFSLLLATLILSFSLDVTSSRANILPLLQSGVNAASSVLKVTKTGAGEGIVVGHTESHVGSISCGEDCSGSFPTNTKVTLTATGVTGKGSFDSWGGACSGKAPTCTVTVAGVQEVTANFVEKTLVRENGIWWGLHNGGRPTFYYVHKMSHYPPTFTLVMGRCETVVVQNDGERFVSGRLIAKQSDVGGRGMAVTSSSPYLCNWSRQSHILYYKEDMPVKNPPLLVP